MKEKINQIEGKKILPFFREKNIEKQILSQLTKKRRKKD